MAKKKFKYPSLQEVKAFDRLKLLNVIRSENTAISIDMEYFLFPFLTGGVSSGFIMGKDTLSYFLDGILDNSDSNFMAVGEHLHNFSIGIKHVFDKVAMEVHVLDETRAIYVVVEDDGNTMRFSQYEYGDLSDIQTGLFDIDMRKEKLIWEYEFVERQIRISRNGINVGGVTLLIPEIENGKYFINQKYHGYMLFKSYIQAVELGDTERVFKFRDMCLGSGTYSGAEIQLIEDLSVSKDRKIEVLTKSYLTDALILIVNYCFTVYFMSVSDKKSKLDRQKSGLVDGIKRISIKAIGANRVVHSVSMQPDYFKSFLRNNDYVRKKAVYSMDEWSVRGHSRKLKSGKEIWIPPCKHRRKDELLGISNKSSSKEYAVRQEDRSI